MAMLHRKINTPTERAVMNFEKRSPFDPSDWDAFRRLAHEVLDESLDHVQNVADSARPLPPVWQQVPHTAEALLQAPPPREGQDPASVAGLIRDHVMPYPTGNTHPRFFGWVHGTGSASALLAEMVATAMNANLGGRAHAAVLVERQVIAWWRDLFGLPETASGVMIGGTSMANVVALAVARNHAETATNVRRDGVRALAKSLVAYASAEAHSSVAKALSLLGLGEGCLRPVPVDDRHAMRADALTALIEADRAAGLHPFAVIGTVGTVNTGALDPLDALADVCATQGLWLHVDGAFGGMLALSKALKPLIKGIERADSIAFDFHKWMPVPFEAAAVLVRDGAAHHATFATEAPYLTRADRGLAAGQPWLSDYTPELSRGFKALKVWFAMMQHGTEALGARIEDNVADARWLAEAVTAHPDLQALHPLTLNILCLRFNPADRDLPDAALNKLNAEIVVRLHESGVAAPSVSRLDGHTAIRVALVNHRARQEDLQVLLDAVIALGHTILNEETTP